MKRTMQRSDFRSRGVPRSLDATEVARVKGGATAIEYGLSLAPTAVEYAVAPKPAAE